MYVFVCILLVHTSTASCVLGTTYIHVLYNYMWVEMLFLHRQWHYIVCLPDDKYTYMYVRKCVFHLYIHHVTALLAHVFLVPIAIVVKGCS